MHFDSTIPIVHWDSTRRRDTTVERFWSKVDKSGECWLWTAGRAKNGYGLFAPRHGVQMTANRFAYEITYGNIPLGLFCCHRCDVRLCVRPDHLFVGDAGVNNRDTWQKGHGRHQSLHGSEHGCAKLSEGLVAEIRARYQAGGISQTALSKIYGVGYSAIHQIVHRQTWTHVP